MVIICSFVAADVAVDATRSTHTLTLIHQATKHHLPHVLLTAMTMATTAYGSSSHCGTMEEYLKISRVTLKTLFIFVKLLLFPNNYLTFSLGTKKIYINFRGMSTFS